jgi:hypothetical protein
VALRLFPQSVRVNGRLILVGDGIKIPATNGDEELEKRWFTYGKRD